MKRLHCFGSISETYLLLLYLLTYTFFCYLKFKLCLFKRHNLQKYRFELNFFLSWIVLLLKKAMSRVERVKPHGSS